MCGRFSLHADARMIANLLECPFLADFHIEKRYNIAPSQWILIVRPVKDQDREPLLAQWGLVPSWTRDPVSGPRPINARCEGIASKATFRGALRYGRCLIPASGFYEWKIEGKRKTPHFIQPRGGGIFILAGLMDTWTQVALSGPDGELTTCTIITTTANPLMASLHDRQPVILDQEGAAKWLNPSTKPEEVLQPCPQEWMEAWEVSAAVGNTKNDGPSLIAPVVHPSGLFD